MKFQLVYFVAFYGKPFKMYKYFIKFEKETHIIKFGHCFLNNTAP